MSEIDAFVLPSTIVSLMALDRGTLASGLAKFICIITTPEIGESMLSVLVLNLK